MCDLDVIPVYYNTCSDSGSAVGACYHSRSSQIGRTLGQPAQWLNRKLPKLVNTSAVCSVVVLRGVRRYFECFVFCGAVSGQNLRIFRDETETRGAGRKWKVSNAKPAGYWVKSMCHSLDWGIPTRMARVEFVVECSGSSWVYKVIMQLIICHYAPLPLPLLAKTANSNKIICPVEI